MTLDIREGDTLVLGGNEYPIRAVGVWKWDGAASLGMQRMLTETASTKRPPAVAGGKRGAAQTYLTGIKCSPLDPADPAWRAEVFSRDSRLDTLKSYAQMMETTVDDDGRFLRLMVEQVKQFTPG